MLSKEAMESKQQNRRSRLERLNAAKNIDYEEVVKVARGASWSASSPPDSTGILNTRNAKSLDVFPSLYTKKSFRIDGSSDDEIDILCSFLGISGPDDFSISVEDWEKWRARFLHSERLKASEPVSVSIEELQENQEEHNDGIQQIFNCSRVQYIDNQDSADSKDLTVPSGEVVELEEGLVGDTSKNPTSNDDEIPIATAEIVLSVSSNDRFKRRIKSWMPGQLLGSGSYGRVFEAISEEGVFFAVKEVSLLDQGITAQPCINELEQEIALLSQFEHENIVQYYGTEKEEGKLLIFLELVSQGSLVSLYQKYILRDSQVSAYTRQILNGLNYLHERNVVHRDIKCANILVHSNGSVKLADFGLAKEMTKINVLKSCKGSIYWMAPEVVNPRRTYGSPADIWSLGCTVLEMLTRDIPFPNLEWTVAFYMIGQGQHPPIPDNLSKVARDFIAQCVKVNPDDRPTAAELLEHPFIRGHSLSPESKFYSESKERWS